jgi:CRP-like cAMP-binding protein
MSNLASFNRKVSPQSWSRGHSDEPSRLNQAPVRVQNLRVIAELRSFQRKELIPPKPHRLWMIEQGLVKTAVWNESGESSLLGLWGQGEFIAQPLTSGTEYHIECITPVKAHPMLMEAVNVQEVRVAQIQQMEFLLELMHCYPIPQRIMKFLSWLAQKAGHVTAEGCVIDLSLTHQAIAEMIGTTRVTITRLLQQLEADGQLMKLHHHRILLISGWQSTAQYRPYASLLDPS